MYNVIMRLFRGKESSKSENQTSNETGKPRGSRPDAIFRMLRIIEARVAHLEESNSTLRRDLNRIEKRQYTAIASEKAETVGKPMSDIAFDELMWGKKNGNS